MLDVIYEFTASMGLADTKLPSRVRGDIVATALVLPIDCANVRWPVADELSATDATTLSGGSVSNTLGPRAPDALYLLAEHRGEYVRHDWDALNDHDIGTHMLRPQTMIQTFLSLP